MALNNVPTAGQTLYSSRDLINQNFSVINTAFSVNHVPYNDGSGNQGFHQFLNMPSGTPSAATNNGTPQIGLYANSGATSGVPELFFQRNNLAANNGYAITEGSSTTTAGWSRLGSGLIMKWVRAQSMTNVSSQQFLVNSSPWVGPSITNIYNVQFSPVNLSNTKFDHVISIGAFGTAPASFTLYTENSGTTPSSNYGISAFVIGL